MFSDMKMGLPQPTEPVTSLNEMRIAIEQGARDSSLIHQAMESARYQGLSGEDKYVLLAYHALLVLEDFHKRTLRFMELSPSVPMILKTDGTVQE
jgi:hypothetical protein